MTTGIIDILPLSTVFAFLATGTDNEYEWDFIGSGNIILPCMDLIAILSDLDVETIFNTIQYTASCFNSFNDDNLIDIESTFAWLNGESQYWTAPG